SLLSPTQEIYDKLVSSNRQLPVDRVRLPKQACHRFPVSAKAMTKEQSLKQLSPDSSILVEPKRDPPQPFATQTVNELFEKMCIYLFMSMNKLSEIEALCSNGEQGRI